MPSNSYFFVGANSTQSATGEYGCPRSCYGSNCQCDAGSGGWTYAGANPPYARFGYTDATGTAWYDNADNQCTLTQYVVCACLVQSTPAPTVSPTTSQPSKSPSRAPSSSPTTSKPSKSPSRAPTTSMPSRAPSKSPTKRPTTRPSRSPSLTHPSGAPTPPTSSPTAPTIAYRSKCGAGRCQTRNSTECITGAEPQCGCAPSQLGVFCWECSFQGYLNDQQQCVCNARNQDPNDVVNPCTPIVQTAVTLDVTRVLSTSVCECFMSRTRGMFKSSIAYQVKLGDVSPPTCDVCYSDGVGPPPETVVDVSVVRRPLACTQYGGYDPLVPDSVQWKACSGHGAWNSETFRCDCDYRWRLRDTQYAGYAPTNETVVTCDACAPLWGPPAVCNVPWTPDPLTGVSAECGGHGTYSASAGACACYGNSTAGYWTLATVTVPTTLLRYTHAEGSRVEQYTYDATQQSCVACAAGYGLPQNGCGGGA